MKAGVLLKSQTILTLNEQLTDSTGDGGAGGA